MMKIALLTLTCCLLCSCGAGDNHTIATEQRAALEKAKGVEADLQKAAQQNQQAAEKQAQ